VKFLSLENLTVSFGGVIAIGNFSLEVVEGEILSLIGPNGAGKTTLFNCISRLNTPDEGKIIFKGQNLLAKKTHQIANLGIARTFQNIELFSNMTVIENILLGSHIFRRCGLLSQTLFYGKARQEEMKW